MWYDCYIINSNVIATSATSAFSMSNDLCGHCNDQPNNSALKESIVYVNGPNRLTSAGIVDDGSA